MMNWYKQAQIKIEAPNYEDYGNLKVLVDGKPYSFGPIDKDIGRNLVKQIRNQPWEHGNIFNMLRIKYNLKNKETDDDRQLMLNQLYEEGYLK